VLVDLLFAEDSQLQQQKLIIRFKDIDGLNQLVCPGGWFPLQASGVKRKPQVSDTFYQEFYFSHH
jgi:hypothetical protein